MDRRTFFGSMAALVGATALPRLFPGRLPYEAPTLTPLPTVISPALLAMIQERTLARVYRDSLYPRLLFRIETADRGPGVGTEFWPEGS